MSETVKESTPQDEMLALLNRIAASNDQIVKLLVESRPTTVRIDRQVLARTKREAERRRALIERYEARNGQAEAETA